jgi:tetratricopeptide (TPR) repeat protein
VKPENGPAPRRGVSSGYWRSDLPNFTPKRLKARFTAWQLTFRASRLRKHDQAKAEAFYRRAVAAAESALAPEDPAVVEPLWWLAEGMRERGEYADAEAAFRRIYELRKMALGPANPMTIWSESRLAMVLSDQGRHAEAEDLLRSALVAYERTLGSSSVQVAFMLDLLGEVAYRTGRYREAEGLFRRSLAIKQRKHKREGIAWTRGELARTLGYLANELSNQGKLGEAERLWDESRQLAVEGLGPRHVDVAAILVGLAGVKQRLGRLSDAEKLYRDAYEIYQEDGKEPEGLADAALYLGGLLRREARFPEAERLYRHSLELREKLSQPRHPEKLCQVLDALAVLLVELARYSDADEVATRALTLTEKHLGPEDPDLITALNTLADARDGQGRCGEAYGLHLRALSNCEAGLAGARRASVLYSLGFFASHHDGLTTEAEASFRHALHIREELYGATHPLVAWVLEGLANLYGVDRPLDAEPLYERALAILHAAYGSDYLDAADALVDLAEIAVHQNELDRGKAVLDGARTVTVAAVGATHPDFAYVMKGIGHLHLHAGRIDAALDAFQQALFIIETTLGVSHPDQVEYLEILEEALRNVGRQDEADQMEARASRLRTHHVRLDPLAVLN